MLYATGGVLLIPSCLHKTDKASILLKKISVDADQEKMMAELCETIIPATDTPGAKDVSAHLFALMMVDDCLTKDEQQKFLAGLKACEQKTKKDFSKPYVELSAAQRESLLKELEAGNPAKDDAAFFYSTVKKLTIRAYTTSKFFLTNVQVYELVPGRWHGSVPVKKSAQF